MATLVRALMAVAVLVLALSTPSLGEGSIDVGTTQKVLDTTTMYVDIVLVGEVITWDGRDRLYIYSPSTDNQVANINGAGSYTTTEVGAHRLALNRDQNSDWDVKVTNGATEHLGRLWSTNWRFNAGSFSAATSASFYSPFTSTLGNKVVEAQFEGLAGYVYSVFATADGIYTNSPTWMSTAKSGNDVNPSLQLYLNPPEVTSIASTIPFVADTELQFVSAKCHDRVLECVAATQDIVIPRIVFTTPFTGQYSVIFDVNQDGGFDFISDSDVRIDGVSEVGENIVIWDGRDGNGDLVAPGNYTCRVFVYVAQIHFPLDDVETIYPGLRMFSLTDDDPPQRIGLSMYWDDSSVSYTPVLMDNGEYSLDTPPDTLTGMDSGVYGDPFAANDNSRAWGAWQSSSKGNNAFINTFSLVERNASEPFVIEVKDGSAVNCPFNTTLSLWSTNVTEGDLTNTAVTVYYSFNVPTSDSLTMSISVTDVSATAGVDYVAPPATLVFPINEVCGNFTFDVIGDTESEIDEVFVLDFSLITPSFNVFIESGDSLSFTIFNDDPQPTIGYGATSVSVSEGLSGTTTVSFEVLMSNPMSSPVSVVYSTADGTAVQPSDYIAVSSATAVIAPGSLSTTLSVDIQGDNLREDSPPQEYLSVIIESTSGLTLTTTAVANITIVDDDPFDPGISLSLLSGAVTTEAGGTAQVSVVLDAPPLGDVHVPVRVTSNPDEVSFAPEWLTFTQTNWSSPQTVTFTGLDDDIDDGDVVFALQIGSASAPATASTDVSYAGMVGTGIPATFTNTDDDIAGITVSAPSAVTTTESGPGSTATFTVVLESEPVDTVTIAFSSSQPGQATVTASVAFDDTDWSVPKTVTVSGVSEDVDDGDVAYTITVGPVTSPSDPVYPTVTPSVTSIAFTQLNDDSAGITVTPITATSTFEASPATVAQFTVVLTSEPSADVSIAIASSDTTEGTVSAPSPIAPLVFNSGNWNTPVTVSVAGVDDAHDDGDIGYSVTLANAVSGDAKYSGRAPSITSFALTNIDDDTAALSLSALDPGSLVYESSTSTATFKAVLGASPAPGQTVTFSFTSSDTSQGTVSPASVVFTDGDWSAEQDVTITAVNDDVDDGDVAFTVSISQGVSGDAAYSGLDPPFASYSLTNVDDDTAGLVLTAASGNTGESGATATLTLALATKPTADVTVTIASSDTGEGIVAAPTSLTFTDGDWSSAQTITVAGVDDLLIDGAQAYSVSATIDTTSDPVYAAVSAVSRPLINLDNEAGTGSVILTPLSGDLDEGSASPVTFTVQLSGPPGAGHTVSLAVSSNDATESSVAAPTTLVFDDGDWNAPQTVTVNRVNDDLVDGDVSHSIQFTNTVSTDGPWDGIVTSPITIVTLDDDVAGLAVSATTPSSAQVTEAGSTVTFTVALTAQPGSLVSLPVGSSNAAEASVSPASLTFDGTDWSSPKTVTVTGLDNDVDEGNVALSVDLGPSTGGFVGLTGSVAIVNVDDDTAGFTVSAPSSLTVTEAGGTATFTVVLTAEPAGGTVSVGLSVSDASEASVSPTALSFDSTDWSSPQTVTVTGLDDDVDDGDVGFNVVLANAVAPSDPAYQGILVGPGTLAMSCTDDDTAGFTVSAVSGSVGEAGPSSASFTVALTSEPLASVTLSPASSNGAAGTVTGGTSLTFDNTNWSVAQTVTVTGVDDDEDDGDVAFTVTLGPAVSSDGGPGPRFYNSRTVPPVGLVSIDDDATGIVVSSPSGGGLVHEAAGSTSSFTVVLTSRPSATVTLTGIVSSDTSEGTVLPTTLAFAPGVWNVPQTVTVTAVDDAVDDGDVAFVVVVGDVVSTDALYDALAPADVGFTNMDNDTAGILVSGRVPWTTTSESGLSDTLAVVLTAAPAAGSMFVPVSVSDTSEASVAPTALTFTSSDWWVPQTVTVTGKNDIVADGDVAYTVDVGAGVSTGSDYSGLAATNGSWPAVNAGVSAAAIVVTGMSPTSEEGDTANLLVSLGSAPISTVSCPIASDAVDEGVVVSPSTPILNFTTSDWSVPQTVVVAGVSDTIDDGTQMYNIVVGPCTSTSLEYSGFSTSVAMQNLDSLPAINITALTPPITTEAGGLAVFEIALLRAPSQDVVLPVTSSDPSEGVVLGSGLLYYESDRWFLPQQVTIQGQADGITDGDVVYVALIGAAVQGPPEWQAYDPPDIPLTNKDVTAVTVTDVSPGIAPALGGVSHTVTGSGFAPGAAVGVGVKVVPAADTTYVSSTQLIVVSPAQNVSALPFLADVNVTNPDGGFGRLAGAIEFTNDCPFEGMFGSGTDCIPCPSCGYCPGGGRRICALPGCWNQGIDSGSVFPCDPPERCLGGGTEPPCLPVCADGYDGDFCASCAVGYYAQGDECIPCETGAESFPFAVVITYLAFLSLLAIISIFGSSRSVHLVGFFLLMLQWLMAVGTMAPSRTPGELKVVYLQFGVASFSVELLKPGCLVEESSFPLVFYTTLGLFLGMSVAITLGIGVSGLYQTKVKGKPWRDEVRPEMWKRLGRAITILLSVGYFALTAMALRVVHCVDTPFGKYMQSDASVKCYDAQHMTMTGVAIAVLVFLTLGFLVLAVVRQYRRHRKMELANALAEIQAAHANNLLTDAAAAEQAATVQRYLDEERWWFASTWLLSMLVLAVASTLMTDYPLWQFVMCGVVFVAMMLLSLRASPFRAHWRNKASAVFAGFCFLCAGFNLLASDGSDASDSTLEKVSYGLLVALLLILILFVVLVVRSVRRNLYYQIKDAGEENVLDEGVELNRVDINTLFAAESGGGGGDAGVGKTPGGLGVLGAGADAGASTVVATAKTPHGHVSGNTRTHAVSGGHHSKSPAGAKGMALAGNVFDDAFGNAKRSTRTGAAAGAAAAGAAAAGAAGSGATAVSATSSRQPSLGPSLTSPDVTTDTESVAAEEVRRPMSHSPRHGVPRGISSEGGLTSSSVSRFKNRVDRSPAPLRRTPSAHQHHRHSSSNQRVSLRRGSGSGVVSSSRVRSSSRDSVSESTSPVTHQVGRLTSARRRRRSVASSTGMRHSRSRSRSRVASSSDDGDGDGSSSTSSIGADMLRKGRGRRMSIM